jgi:hypothetical protein
MCKASCGPGVFSNENREATVEAKVAPVVAMLFEPGVPKVMFVYWLSLHRMRNKCIFRLTCSCIELCTSPHHLHRSRQESDAAAGLSEYPIQPMELQGSAYSKADTVR